MWSFQISLFKQLVHINWIVVKDQTLHSAAQIWPLVNNKNRQNKNIKISKIAVVLTAAYRTWRSLAAAGPGQAVTNICNGYALSATLRHNLLGECCARADHAVMTIEWFILLVLLELA